MRWRRRSARDDVRLSVVVPVYNVAPWLANSLDSILRQGCERLQVVIVDDGSTDGSDVIAAAYAARHPQIEVIRQANAGVSIARNVGIDACRGTYLTFVDPDDEVPDGAWAIMLETLERTGSDFTVGSAERRRGEERFITPLMRRNHHVERLGIRIEDQPLMLADVFVWNKMFRRSFWVGAGLRFPERTRYQDQPAMTQAFLAASAFDVLTEVVYDWVVRPTMTSATQRRRDLDNLHERVDTKRLTIDLVRRHESDDLLATLFGEILPIDMWEHFRAVPSTSHAYWVVLRDAVREFWGAHTLPFEDTTVPVQQRLMGWLVAQDRRDDLVDLLDYLDTHPDGLPIVDGELRHPWYGDPALPDRVTMA